MKQNLWIVWGLFITLFTYLVLRSVYVPISHDEVGTFYYYIQTGVYLPPDAHWDANNHILNSFLSHLSYKWFGNESWILRLPNVLSYIIYFWSAWGIARNLKKPFLKWGLFLSLVMSHYIFDYFGQTRGYGLSMAFLLLALWLVQNVLKNRSYWSAIGVILSLITATSANLTLLAPSFLIIAYTFFSLFLTKEFSIRKIGWFLGSTFCSYLLFLPLISFSLDLKERGALYYGGKSGFWDYTGNTLSELMTGYYSPIMAVLYSLIFLLLIAAVFYLLFKVHQKNILYYFNNNSFLFTSVLSGSLVAIFSIRYLLDVNFPEDRAAIYLFPFFVLAIAFVLDEIQIINKNIPYAGLILFYIPIHFIAHINLSRTIFPMQEAPPRDFFDYVSKQYPKNHLGYPSKVGGYATQRLCWAYMNHQKGGRQGEMLVSNHIDTLCDFQIVSIERELPDNFLQLYAAVNEKPHNDLHLYKRKKRLNYTKVYFSDSITNWNHSTNEYFDLIKFTIPDSIKGKPLFIGIDAEVDVEHNPFIASLVVSQKDKNEIEISQEGVHFDWLRKIWREGSRDFKQGIILPEIDKESEQIVVYLWNQKGNNFLLYNGKIELFVLE